MIETALKFVPEGLIDNISELRTSYLNNGIPYTGMMVFISKQVTVFYQHHFIWGLTWMHRVAMGPPLARRWKNSMGGLVPGSRSALRLPLWMMNLRLKWDRNLRFSCCWKWKISIWAQLWSFQFFCWRDKCAIFSEHKQGKSEAFESCDRPIVRKCPIWVKINDVFVPCDLEIWWMILENNRASLLCCFKLCATFHSHRWIQNGVTVRKRPIWVKFDDF